MKKLLSRFKSLIGKLAVLFFRLLPLRRRVFFYSIRCDGRLLENADIVCSALDAKKVVFAKMLPHSTADIFKIKYLLLTSKVIVTDDYLKYMRGLELRRGQRLVQLWHACGAFKCFGLDAPSRLKREEEIDTHRQYDLVCVTSEYVRRFYAGAFGIDIDKVRALGSPRTDELIDPEKTVLRREAFFRSYPALEGKKIFLYLPTFREVDGKVIPFEPKIDFDRLSGTLAEDEVFVVGRHPVMKQPFFPEGRYDNILDLTKEKTSVLLSACDVVATDYSSVIFDACLLKKPVIFYCPDLGDYERNFYLRFPDDLPGDVCSDQDGLYAGLSRLRYGFLPDKKYLDFIEKELSACDGHSTQRIVSVITGYLEN